MWLEEQDEENSIIFDGSIGEKSSLELVVNIIESLLCFLLVLC